MTTDQPRLASLLDLLSEAYPEAVCELDFRTPWQLLVATMLSAQCTDERVNRVTPALFVRWPGPEQLASAPLEEIETVIRPAGLYRSKARHLRETARRLVAVHGGKVPPDLAALTDLPGVGRKTAKVVLGEAFGVAAGVAVDTHVRRLANRIGLSNATEPDRVAADLESRFEKDEWIDLSKRLILHGRRVCTARRPVCDDCPLVAVCEQRGV